MKLRIYADFNSGGGPNQGPCWALRYGDTSRLFDDMADELGLQPGMPVTLFHSDTDEEFEVDAVLVYEADAAVKWKALPDWSTFRRLRGED